MRTLNEWFGEYGESHRNPTNKLIHWICVPAIVFSVIGMLATIPFPASVPFLNWGTVVVVLSLLFYARLSFMMMLGMVAYGAIALLLVEAIAGAGLPVFWTSLAVFVVAWIGQFIGHHIEGKKPSFFKDIQFLLIGPAWVIGFLFRKLGIKY